MDCAKAAKQAQLLKFKGYCRFALTSAAAAGMRDAGPRSAVCKAATENASNFLSSAVLQSFEVGLRPPNRFMRNAACVTSGYSRHPAPAADRYVISSAASPNRFARARRRCLFYIGDRSAALAASL
jgi:hypothetical protein